MLKKVLLPVFAGSLMLAVVVYGCRYINWDKRRPAVVLVDVALHGATEDERALAAAELAEYGEAAKDYMRQVLQQSDSPQVRATCIHGLGNIYDYESVDIFLAGLEDEASIVRGRSAVVLRKLVGRSFSFDPDGAEADRKAQIEGVRKEWESIRDSGLIEQFIERMKRKEQKRTP